MKEIWDFIAVDSIDSADKVVAELLAEAGEVVSFPGRGHRRTDLTSRPLRFLIVREYLIVYAPEEEPLWMVAILHGRRSPRVMAAMLRGRE